MTPAQQFAAALGRGAANHLWQSTVFAVLAALLTLALRKNRAAARYWLWLAASVKFLIPFSLLVSAGARLGWRAAPAIAHSQLSFAMGEIGQPFAIPDPAALPAVAAPALNPMPAILLGVWLCGIAIGVVFWFRCWRRIRAVRRAATLLDLNLPIQVMSSHARMEPGVIGIFKPVLLLPEGIADRLTPPQLEAILAHELRHVQRRDNLTAAIHMLVETIFWFHPLVYWIRARLMEERERACDEEVMRMGREPQVYAESILKVCEFYLTSPAPCAAGVTGGELKKRIESIMANRFARNLSYGKKILLAAAAILVIAGPGVVGLLNPPRGRAQSQAALPPSFEMAPLKAAGPDVMAQAAKPPLRFEVASVKLNRSCAGPKAPPGSPGRLSKPCVTLRTLITLAYTAYEGSARSPRVTQIVGGPAWMGSDFYYVEAKAAGPEHVAVMEGPMLRALLEERFKVETHRETREAPVYDLSVSKGGLKLQPLKEGGCLPYDTDNLLDMHTPVKPTDPEYCGTVKVMITGAPGSQTRQVHYYGVTMADLAGRMLHMFVDRPILDKTGLAGRYDLSLEFTVGDTHGGMVLLNGEPATDLPEAEDSQGPSIFTALQEQAGLRLAPDRGPVEVLVVDRAERPSEN